MAESTNEVVRNALKARNDKAYGVPSDLWGKIRGLQCSYIIAGELKKGKSVDEIEKRLYDSAIGTQTPGRSSDFMRGVEVLREMKRRGLNSAVATNAVEPLDALSSAETFMRQAIGELGKVSDPDFRPLASKIAVKLMDVHGELRRELEV